MRLGISSPLRHNNAEEWAKNQAALGCTSAVFPVQSDADDNIITDYKNAADKYGIMIAEVGIWRNALASDKDEREKNIAYCVDQLRLAERLNARCAVNVAGAFGPRWDGHYKANFTDYAWKQTVSVIRDIIDRADVKDTYFTIEPMPWMIPSSPKEYVRLIDAVDRDRFAVHLDAVNMINSAERYFDTEGFIDECVSLLGSRIRSCHIKDVHLKEEYTFQLEETAPGLGEFPHRYYAQALDGIDSDMPVILEHLDTDEDYIKYLGYLKEELNGLYKTF